MALTRKFLKSLGIEPEAIEEVIREHSETVTALKDQIDTLEEDAKDAPKKEDYDDLKKKYEDLKKTKSTHTDEDYKKLQEEYDNYKSEVEQKEARSKKSEKVKAVLKDIGIPERHYEKILKYSDVDSLELDDKGELKGLAELKKSLETDWSDHIDKTHTAGADTATPPAGTGGEPDLGSLSMADYIAARKKQ